MFKKAKQIQEAFAYVRNVGIAIIGASMLLCGFTLYQCIAMVRTSQSRIYVLAAGKAMEAVAQDRRDNIPVEARDHVRMFHEYFFTLSPDDKQINASVTRALYLSDGSVRSLYDDLKEKGYYSGLISGNVSQELEVDSVKVNVDEVPYRFRCYATQSISRATSLTIRTLITEGQLRSVARSDNNPHGFLIERFNTIENRDIKITTR